MLKKYKKFAEWTVGSKLTLIITVIISLILLSLTAVINYNLTQRAQSQAVADVTDKTQLVVDMLNLFDTDLRDQTSDAIKVFKGEFKGDFELDDRRSIEIGGVSTPVLKSGGQDLNGNFSVPDRLDSEIGVITTVFVKKDDDFIRISTSLKKENGERAIGTMLSHTSPAFQLLSAGKNYIGVAELFHKQYMTQYDPIFDSAGKVIGVLFVGKDFTDSIANIKAKIRAMKIGKSGYFFALDARPGKTAGNLLIHPGKEGQNILDSKDNDGHEFIKTILESKQGVIHYPWINAELGEVKPREKVVAFYPMKSWNWVVAGGIYSDEYAEESNKLTHRYLLVSILVILALAILLFNIMRTRLSKPLQEVIHAAKQLAHGDLTAKVEVDRVDEIGQLMDSINGIGKGLTVLVNEVRESTLLISNSSDEIAQGNHNLFDRTEAQASSLQETATSMDELTSTVKQNSDSAKHANQLVVSTSDIASKGGEVVTHVVETMSAIKDSSKKIVDIISVIDGIAFQTNILALNAAVEAARAGEQGRGFAVVASEVRNLAQRSASAAKEIATLIKDSVEKVDYGNLLAERTGRTMDDVLDSVRQVTEIMAEITLASQEQSSGIEQVNQAVSQMDDMTQQNSALVEQAAAATSTMREQVNNLIEVISAFKLK